MRRLTFGRPTAGGAVRPGAGPAAVALLAVLLLVAGCTGDGDGGSEPDGSRDGGGSPPPAPTSPGPAATSSAGDGAGPSPPAAGWTSGELTVTHEVPVPPVPLLEGIRSAAHPDQGFDRIVFDFGGSLPGYTVRYVDQVRQDGSGQLVTMPGRRYLLIVFAPAQAHTAAGDPLVNPDSQTLDHPMLRGYALVGDFEGQVSVALGLDDVVGYRVGELAGRIYLDVAA